MLTLYRFLTDIAAWPLRFWLNVRAWRGKEDSERLSERRGLPSRLRPQGTLIWCHAASVGESLALLPLIDKFVSEPDTHVLLTTGTVSSAAVMSQRLPSKVTHQFAPWDRRSWVNRFLDHWQPTLALRMESEIWPNSLTALRERNIPIAVVNGRLSDRSFRRWSYLPAQSLFESIDLVCAQTKVFSDRFQRLGVKDVQILPNLKLSAAPLPAAGPDVEFLRQMIGKRPVWLAASTHPSEDLVVFNAHRAIAQKIEGVLTIVVPRHPHRGLQMKTIASENNVNAAVRSSADSITADTDIYIADTFGELGLFFRVAPVVFMGKSIGIVGGQNPIEPSHFDCAILFGPHMENFEDIADTMVKESMAIQVADGDAFGETVSSLLLDEKKRASLSHNANTLGHRGLEGLETTYDALKGLLPKSANNGF